MKKCALLLALLLCLTLPLTAGALIPKHRWRISTLTIMQTWISSADRDAMLALGAKLDEATTAQVVVVAVEFFDGIEAEEYGYQLFIAGESGDMEEGNGVLLLLSVGEREYWSRWGKALKSG